ncbi:MAG: c-type cytochrome [Thiomonas sp.]|uniref:c-type cytochrome n=1 Tax=Thiomonas sp. TaxID=2047785 RepID=UPI002A36F4D8|nr:c-type cytochrome [Thiomonas sp.]MDY0331550.1 c-type cytochrome [Thiomonas sp.]
MPRPFAVPALISTLFAAALAFGTASASAATAPPGQFTATAKVSSLDEAAAQGAQIFANDSFGSKQTWVPPNAFSSHAMTCAACHTDGGKTEGTTPTGAHLPSLIGAAAKYPKFKAKKHAVYTLERQIVHCVRAGIMGKPPGYNSPEMIDLVAYLTQISKGATMGQQFK